MPYVLEQLHGADNAASALVGAYAAGVTVLVVADGSAFPAVPFTAALGSGTAAYEEVVVTGVAGGTFTLLAATVQAHPNGEVVENTIGAEVLKRLSDFATGHTHAGGNDGATLPASGVTDHALLSNVTANQHHAQSHAIGGADHSGQLAHTALTSIGTNTHPQIDTALATAVTNDATAAAHIADTAPHHAFATPAIGLGTAAAPGAATTVIRSDSTIAAFDATVPVTQAYSDAAATGSANVAARRDHKHGMPASGGATYATPAVLLASAAAAGAAGTGIRSDSTIAAFDTTAPTTSAPADAAAVGTAAFAARRDHVHGREAANPVRVASTASAATLTLPAGQDIIVPITGTVTIAAITLRAGCRATLEFASGGCQVTNGGILLAGAHYISSAGGTLTLECDGGQWMEIGRSPHTDAGAPSTQAFGDAAASGTQTVWAKRDHKHAMPANPVTGLSHTALAAIGTNTHAQVDTHLAASAGVHGLGASANVLGDANAVGDYIRHGGLTVSGTNSTAQTFGVVNQTPVTFAVAFASAPRLFLGCNGTSNLFFASANSPTASGFTPQAWGGASASPGGVINWLALSV